MATYYFLNTGNTAWNTGSNWGSASGGGTPYSVPPTAADDVIFDNNSGNCTLSGTAGVCKTFNAQVSLLTRYTGTFTVSTTLAISGNFTLSAAMTYTGSSVTTVNAATATLTSNGDIMSAPLTITSNSGTITLADDWTINGNIIIAPGAGGTVTINSNNIIAQRNLTFSGNQTTTVQGSAGFKLTGVGTGTSTWTLLSYLKNNVTIDCGSNTIAFTGSGQGSNFFTGTLSYVSGVAGAFSSFLNTLGGNSLTLNWNGNTTYLPFSIYYNSGTTTITLSSNVYIGSLSGGGVGNIGTFVGGYNLYLNGGHTLGLTNGAVTLIFTGTGTIGGSIATSFTINSPSGTLTLASTLASTPPSGGMTVTYTAGIVDSSTNSNAYTITGSNPITFSTNGMTWYSINLISMTSVVINSLLRISNNLTNGATSIAFSGTAGWTVGTFVLSNPTGITFTLAASTTYTLTAGATGTATAASPGLIRSSSTPTRAVLTLTGTTTMDLGYINVTDIDSSAGQTFWSYGVVSSNSTNWLDYSNYPFNVSGGGVF